MKRLQINLKAGSIERRQAEFLREAFNKVILIEAIFWVVLLGINFSLSFQIHNLKKRLSSIEAEWKTTEPLLKEREYLLEWKDGYAEVFNSLRQIFKRDLSWFAVFKSFSDLVPAEMCFKEVALRGAGEKRILEIRAGIGYLSSDEEKLKKINSFLESVKKDKVLSENFEVPELKDITKAQVRREEVMDLKFSLTLKK